MDKMVYEPNGAVFWDDMTGIRRWGDDLYLKDRPGCYLVVPLFTPVFGFFRTQPTLAVVDDFGTLVRVQ